MSRLGHMGGAIYRGEISYDFVGKRRRWYAISAVILILAIGGFAFRGLNLGIEFKGGAEFLIQTSTATVEQTREAVEAAGVVDPIVTQAGTQQMRVQTLDLTGVESQKVVESLSSKLGVPTTAISVQLVGPSWGGEITTKALQGLVLFLIAVTIFLSLYFEWRMAVAALVALLHDLVITIGIYALSGFEVTPATVIGVLTILGFSLYDTVVVFDKVKENTHGITSGNRSTYSEAANLALNQTLVRSINTSIVALLPVTAILVIGVGFLGAGTLKDLALALFIGTLAGTYSSIFIATPLLAQLKEREPAMKALATRVAARRAGLSARTTKAPTSSGGTSTARSRTAVLDPAEQLEDDPTSEPTEEGEAPSAPSLVERPGAPTGPRTQPRRPPAKRKRKR
ncbi:MAG TPA: protein translocase subunit SecF [Candidatus Nanopelagicales bacterium]|jgi:preprotein translocase subunit SecF